MTVWFGSRVYLHFHLEPMWHPMAKAYEDMAVGMNDGGKLGEINLSRIARNKDVTPTEPYKTAAYPGDEHCQYRTLDPGYGVFFAAARQMVPFVPDSQLRPVVLQVFLDFLLPFLLFATFYRWGWFAAVGSVVIYSLNVVFAVSSITAWTYYLDGLTAMLSLIALLWLYRMAKKNATIPAKAGNRWVLITLAVVLGAILGAGIWIRNSWFIFGVGMFILAAFSKTLRPWLLYAVVTFGIFAGGMFVRSSVLNGYPSMSTRMVWHTAMQGIGKYPNVYGIEDNDLYMFNRTYREAGAHFDYCNYNEHDKVIEKDFGDIWQHDRGFVIRGVIQRMFSNTFLNFNLGGYDFWNHGMLALAWLGMLCGLWVGGELGLVAGISFVMFMFMNVSYAFVYYLFRQYSTPTQAFLMFGAVAFIAAISQFVGRCMRGDGPKFKLSAFGINGPTLANLTFILTALVMVVVMIPPVQSYLTPPFPVSLQADMPEDIVAMPDISADTSIAPKTSGLVLEGLADQINNLSPAKKQALMRDIKTRFHMNDVKEFANAHLKHFVFMNADGSMHPVWLSEHHSVDAHEVLVRAPRSIEGLGYTYAIGFDPNIPSSWSGNELRFALVKNTALPSARVRALLDEKFTEWGWKLTELPDHSFLAVHTSAVCSPMRRELTRFFPDQCDEHDPDKTH